MFVVDTQIHIWKEETPDRPWVPGARERIRLNGHREDPFSYEEALELMDEAGVNRALILPPSWEGNRIDYALEACEADTREMTDTENTPGADGGEALVSAFNAVGADYVFCSSGSEWAPVWESLARRHRDGQPAPEYLDLTHETVAVGMATG
ncbi:hypothetical protein [Streptomyces sp. NPDC006446]|uniref:hypothetical protein n=1 Tax=Streptomyces sp. NPDC006446 TaxID=3154301 RepID=UPI0033B26D4A